MSVGEFAICFLVLYFLTDIISFIKRGCRGRSDV